MLGVGSEGQTGDQPNILTLISASQSRLETRRLRDLDRPCVQLGVHCRLRWRVRAFCHFESNRALVDGIHLNATRSTEPAAVR